MSQFSPILPSSLQFKGKVLSLEKPLVMGILNLTPDSFYDGGKYSISQAVALNRVKEMIAQGVSIIDIGGASTRPGAKIVDPEEEQKRVLPYLEVIVNEFPDLWISIDTYHASTARLALDSGVSIINDVSAGSIDPEILKVAGEYNCPYILMHMLGSPETMQKDPLYTHIVKEVCGFFQSKVASLKQMGIRQIILDPGFGFGKNLDHNFQLLKNLGYLSNQLSLPMLVGISRKSMVNKVIGTRPEEALNGTTALHMLALLQGASILRVHDVKEAHQAIQLFLTYQSIES